MKFPLFFLLALCISKAAAFGLYGCYERLMYWQAYQMDSGSKKQRIAKACSRDAETAKVVGPVSGGRCNLRQFLYYISASEEEKATIADKSKMKDADLAKENTALDEVASKLYGANVGRNYQPGRIYENLGPTSGTHEARSRVQYGRQANAVRDIGTEIRKKYDNEVWEKQPKTKKGEVEKDVPLVKEGLVKERMGIPNGGVDGWITCDLQDAKTAVNAEETKAGREPMKLKDFIDDWSTNEGGHRLNINAAKDAKLKISGGCSA
ncbi:uncharacterized protein ASPGLDRAFT_65480 [Aspergillus glaucus CBS 516.65]|uniref:Uncharacterized protein n=1 Tax=Aspergillus glaucus CBS 516.65 TaxID=1160497 RepID=A0A1L9VNK9_ASPGL|nr:hypothetical protein ASPGLDRAFT_65480 [Aspergillus glaucus CBS 516.65]OJJ85482.1 hypothetical protein ASPGLDRAFT_65480 [Aspergillus glaucus CBS 516.65]